MTSDCINLDIWAKRLLADNARVMFTDTGDVAVMAVQLLHIAYRDGLNSGYLDGKVDSFGEFALMAAGEYLSIYSPQLIEDSNLFDNN